MEATLNQILDSRERRVQRQKELLEAYKKPLLCFTMNIPGPVKLDRDVTIGFYVGCRLLDDALRGHPVLHTKAYRETTGCEAYYVVDMPADQLKQLAMDIEDTPSIGRLFDMDVLDTNGRKRSREELGGGRRPCLLCDNDGVVCARNRAHSLAELRERVSFLLYLAARQYLCEYIAVQAYFALHQEVSTTPKPGLVDRNNRGSHKDMDVRHFFASENALRPFFCQFAEAGYLTRDDTPRETFRALRVIGMEAEQAMLKATGGVNTHKGAIFSLGLVCGAAGRLDPANWSPESLLRETAAMTEGLVALELAQVTAKTAKTAGEFLYLRHGITGIRGQAEAGFPAVLQVGLPVLRQGLSQGLSLNDAGAATLLHLLCVTEDTNLINRGGYLQAKQTQEQISRLLQEDPFPPGQVIEDLDRAFIQKGISPGGAADLLALTYLCQFLCS